MAGSQMSAIPGAMLAQEDEAQLMLTERVSPAATVIGAAPVQATEPPIVPGSRSY